jgi:hypothetical protein
MGTYGPTDRPTDQRTNGPTNAVSYRGATSRLKIKVTMRFPEKREKLKPGARSPGAKQYGAGPTNRPTDEKSYRGAMLAPKIKGIT